MEHQPYLIIEIHGSRYGLDAYAVQEIFFLPEITPLPESPPDVVGVINLRGEVLPIVDLRGRFGLPPTPYQISDSVVVLGEGNTGPQVGLVVNRTYEVQSIPRQNICDPLGRPSIPTPSAPPAPAPSNPALVSSNGSNKWAQNNQEASPEPWHGGDALTFQPLASPSDSTIASPPLSSEIPTFAPLALPLMGGIAKMETEIITLLNPQRLIHYGHWTETRKLPDWGIPGLTDNDRPEAEGGTPPEAKGSPGRGESWGDRPGGLLHGRDFFPEATPEERALLQRRAENLRKETISDSATGLVPYAVVGLQGEYFGLGLEVIHEFTDVTDVSPIPCCPPHVVGNINLRGEILTLVDMSGLLNLPLSRSQTSHKAIVARLDHLVAGITVDEVFDVVYLRPGDIAPVPAAIHALNDEFIRGVAPYQDHHMSILELPKLLNSPELIVDEMV